MVSLAEIPTFIDDSMSREQILDKLNDWYEHEVFDLTRDMLEDGKLQPTAERFALSVLKYQQSKGRVTPDQIQALRQTLADHLYRERQE